MENHKLLTSLHGDNVVILHETFIMTENSLPAVDREHTDMLISDHVYRAADSAI